ncbi:MAG: FecR domain-containing protein [Sphingobium sp.]
MHQLTRRQVAAGILAAGTLGTGLHFMASGDRHSTQHGERTVAHLPDNSSIALNGETVLDVSLGKHRRLVRLEKGEALFDVARDEKRPFVIDLGGAEIEVLGTKFNVRRNTDFIELTVLEGLVAVSSGPAGKLKVPAGSAAIIRPGLTTAAIRDPNLVHQRASWVDGFLQFDNEPLEQVVEEFNRYRNAPLLIGDPRIRSTLIAGRFGIDESAEFVDALESSFDIRADRQTDGTVILMGKLNQ